MKLSVSLPDEDVATLDEYARTAGLSSRSAAVQHAIRMLRHPELEAQYEEAFNDWESTGDAGVWGATVDDGIADAAR